MFIHTQKARGMTLLEALLVLAIVALLVVLSLRQYALYQNNANVTNLQTNVDNIFLAMSAYYKSNCGGTLRNGTWYYGSLSPKRTPAPAQNFPVSLQNDLIGKSYLKSTIVPNPLVGGADLSESYVLQFNEVVPRPERFACRIGTNASGPNAASCSQKTVGLGRIIIWKAQVAVLLANPAEAEVYRQLLGADCLSSLSDDIVLPCSANSPGNYVVWERLPSMSGSKMTSLYWATMPQTQLFNQMYLTDPLLSLTAGVNTNVQNYICNN